VVLYEDAFATEKPLQIKRLPELKDFRVLVVDDEPDTRLLMTTIIENCGASVMTVDSAREAFAALEHFKPHLLISDIGMPEEDGYSLMRRIRNLPSEAGGTIPAIALTAYAREEDRRKALETGFQKHLAKPVKPEDLVAVVCEFAKAVKANNQEAES
jgi:CheY-like chemotaxis protein